MGNQDWNSDNQDWERGNQILLRIKNDLGMHVETLVLDIQNVET